MRIPVPNSICQKISQNAVRYARRSGQVLPSFSLADARDGRLTDTQPISHFLMGQIGLRSDPKRIVVGQLCRPTPCSITGTASFHHLSRVFWGSSQVKMSRLNADRSIAVVQDPLIVINGTAINLVGDSMCPKGHLPHPDQPIPFLVSTTSPVPAPSIGGRGARHEPRKGFGFRHSVRPQHDRPASRGRPVSLPSLVVGRTPSPATCGVDAAMHRTVHAPMLQGVD